MYVNLLESKDESSSQEAPKEVKKQPITHLLTNININAMDSVINFDRYQLPGEIYPFLRFNDKNEYLPILHIDKMSIKNEEYKVTKINCTVYKLWVYINYDFLKPLNDSQTEYILSVNYQPLSVGKLRLFKQLEISIESFKELGINDDQLKEVISLFTETNLYLLMLTFFVSVFHVS